MSNELQDTGKDTSKSCVFDFPDRPVRPTPPTDGNGDPIPTYPYEPDLDWPLIPHTDPPTFGVEPIPKSDPHPYSTEVTMLQIFAEVFGSVIYPDWSMQVSLGVLNESFGPIEYGIPGVFYYKDGAGDLTTIDAVERIYGFFNWEHGKILFIDTTRLAGDITGQIIINRICTSFVGPATAQAVNVHIRTLNYDYPAVEHEMIQDVAIVLQAWQKPSDVQLNTVGELCPLQTGSLGDGVANAFNFAYNATTGAITLTPL